MSSRGLLGPLKQGKIFIISAPAGTGKTTLMAMLRGEFADRIVASVSCTTRPQRPNEIQGVHYHFMSRDAFEKRLQEEDFLEYAEVFGHYYGTSKRFVADRQAEGRHVFLVIDTQGALKIRQMGLDAVSIFISPPSLEELQRRLKGRRTESASDMEQRLTWAQHELAQVSHYDYHIVNDDLQRAYQIIRSIVIAETHKVVR